MMLTLMMILLKGAKMSVPTSIHGKVQLHTLVVFCPVFSFSKVVIVLTHSVITSNNRGDFWAQSVEILVFARSASYMLTSSGFPLLNRGIFCKFL